MAVSARPRACSQWGDAVGEQPVQRIGQQQPAVVLGPAAAGIGQERVAGAEVDAAGPGSDQRLGERADVGHAHVQALGVDRVDAVRRVADQRQARRDVALGVERSQRDRRLDRFPGAGGRERRQ